MRARRIAVALTIVGVVGAGSPAVGATTRRVPADPSRTTIKTITARCSVVAGIHPSPPTNRDFVVTTTAPGKVVAGATVTVHLSVPFTVSPDADLGVASVTGGPDADPQFGYVSAPPGAPAIVGDVSFTVTGARGSQVTWRLGGFGQMRLIGSTTVYEVCRPRTPDALLRTRIT